MPPTDLLSPRPLRANFTHPNPTVVSAYSICRAAEHVIVSDPIQDSDHLPPDNPTAKTKLVNIRVLGHLLSQTRLLSDAAVATVATGILSCRTDPAGSDGAVDVEALSALGELYRNHLLRPLRRFKGPTPDVSSHPSRPPSKLTEEEVDQMLAEAPGSYSRSRDLAMQREDFRCIVTRTVDKPYAKEHRLPGYYNAETLELCHIFPEDSTTSYNVERVLRNLGYSDIANDLATTSDNVHSLENAMMMIHRLHDNFGTLELWFEPVEGMPPNRYRVRSLLAISPELADGQETTFQSTHPRLALPSPEHLRIHAACCRVAHLSGAAGLFNEVERDLRLDPDPTVEGPAFSRALHAHLDHLSLTAVEAR